MRRFEMIFHHTIYVTGMIALPYALVEGLGQGALMVRQLFFGW